MNCCAVYVTVCCTSCFITAVSSLIDQYNDSLVSKDLRLDIQCWLHSMNMYKYCQTFVLSQICWCKNLVVLNDKSVLQFVFIVVPKRHILMGHFIKKDNPFGLVRTLGLVLICTDF